MRSISILAAAALAVMAVPAYATPGNNGGGNGGCGQGQQTNGCGGSGGGGNASAANSNSNFNQNANWNANTNVNANRNVNRNTNAQGQFQGQGQGQGQGQSQSTSVSQQGGSQSYSVYSPVNTDPWANPAASAIAPSVYVTSICQTGASGAVQLPMVGFSFGITAGREFCVAMMKAHEYAAKDPAMARYFECQSSDVRAAYKAVGHPCPQDGGTGYRTVAQAPVAAVVAVAAPKTYPRCGHGVTDNCISD